MRVEAEAQTMFLVALLLPASHVGSSSALALEVAADATVHAYRCCSMEETSPTAQMLLGCDEDEVIHEVDFGRFGVDGSTEGWCGAFVAVNAAAGVDVGGREKP